MGCDPAVLPGSVPLDRGRQACEALWGAPLPVDARLQLMEMMDAALAGRLKALWAIGYDVLLTNPNATETRRALRSLELVIVQDMFLTETARECGTVFLPACSSFEKEGTFMNAERRIQRVRAALRPIGSSRPDWQIVCGDRARHGRPWIRVRRVRKTSGTRYARSVTGRAACRTPGSTREASSGRAPPNSIQARRFCTSTRSRSDRAQHCKQSMYRRDIRSGHAGISVHADHRALALSVQRRHDDRTNTEHRASFL